MGYPQCKYCENRADYTCDNCGKHLCRGHVVHGSTGGWFGKDIQLCQACMDEAE